jgi:hypothetical protein
MDHVSEDGNFTVSEVECLGACVNAPMMQVNNEWCYEVKNFLLFNTYLGSNSREHYQSSRAIQKRRRAKERSLNR